jgi:hypothetical protein
MERGKQNFFGDRTANLLHDGISDASFFRRFCFFRQWLAGSIPG